MNNLTYHLKEKEQTSPKVSRREIIKIKEEIKQRKSNRDFKKIEKNNKTKSWFIERVHKIDKPLTRFTKKEKENPNK